MGVAIGNLVAIYLWESGEIMEIWSLLIYNE